MFIVLIGITVPQLVILVTQLAKLKNNLEKIMPFLVLTILFIISNVTIGFGITNHLSSFAIGVSISACYFYILISQLLVIKSYQLKLGLFFLGLILSLLLYFLLYKFASQKSISFEAIILTFYFLLGSTISLYFKFSNKLRTLDLLLNGASIIFYVLTVSLTFSYKQLSEVLLSVNLLYFFVIIDYFIGFSNSKRYALIQRIKFESFIIAQAEPDISNFDLTPSELEVANLMLEGLNIRQMAEKLDKSEGLTRKHSQSVFKKTNCEDRAEFIFIYVKNKV